MKEFLLRSILAANTVIAPNKITEMPAARQPASLQTVQVERDDRYDSSSWAEGASEFFGYQKHIVIFNF
jgi:hypothetical protein